MDEIPPDLDPDELMDLEEPESYELEEDEDDIPDDPATSPFQQFSSGPASNATSTTSSPPNNDDFPMPFNFAGKPLTMKRGRGRPKREGGKPVAKRSNSGTPRVRRAKPAGFSRCRGSRISRQLDRMDFEFYSPSSMEDMALGDLDAFFSPERERPSPLFEELPYAPEAWPGKVCAFCNLGERSQLGQGEMLRLNCPEGFTPQRPSSDCSSSAPQLPEKDPGDKSPRGPVTCRRNKNFSRSRSFLLSNEHVDELTIIGHAEEPSVSVLYEVNGQFYVHRNCALWSSGVFRTDNQALENVGPVVLRSSSQKCSFCNHYGASLGCKSEGCVKVYHFPCATASGAFQDVGSLSVYCGNHLGEATVYCEGAICYTCKSVGDIANLIYCSSCGTHYHGSCVGLAQLPGVRAGWQCRKCRICQVCRTTGDETKLMSCEQCDKVYHASCQRPIVTSIPKYGWKCRCCRVCGDCGSRTPGAGLSSRWHLHYTVCDSCYQQRNKGCCCPICQRAYRSHAHREMIQCTSCRKFVHGTCDPEADPTAYQQKKEINPDYEYHCTICKNSIQQQMQMPSRLLSSKRASTDDPGDFSTSQDSLYDDMSELDGFPGEEPFRVTGLGKGKPYASKIAKKKLSYTTGIPGRPKGGFGKGVPGKQGFMKRQRLVEFGRKRGAKAKIRGLFGVPGVGLSRPMPDGKNDEEPGVENRLVLCSSRDKFVLTQDICVMCGALGTDQEGCLISCVQCGQCYHPYCINVKVTKVILQKGWRCLDCTVCEGCGQRNDEGRLILCDDCDVSYHTYCMDPPLDYVPHGNWKCKWCACCRTCGSADPGFNSSWMNECTQCGPCASHTACPSCNDPYSEGDLIIQCAQCERWLHGICDLIKSEQDAEKCAEDGYTCVLCRPRDVPPPHLIVPPAAPKPPTPTKSPEVRTNANFFVDGVCLSESGHSVIKSLCLEYHGTRKKRKKMAPVVHDKEAGIMAAIESVVAGGCTDSSFEDTKIEIVDMKEEPQDIYKEGMIWTKEDGPPPEGFTVFTMESGVSVLRRKRQRNLQKLGIGGFLVRIRGFKSGQENDDIDTLPGQTTPTGIESQQMSMATGEAEKAKKKPIRRKPKSKLVDTFPSYLQEAFFGKDLMDLTDFKKEVESSSSDEDKSFDKQGAIKLTPDELLAMETIKQEHKLKTSTRGKKDILHSLKDEKQSSLKQEEDDNNEDLKDVLALPGDLLDTELVNSIINEDDELAKNTELDALADDDGELAQTLDSSENSKDTKDELSDILGSHFSLESIPNINSKDVEDIFKGVLTDESQESQLSQDSNIFPSMPSTQSQMFSNTSPQLPSATIPQMHLPGAPVRPSVLPGVPHVSFPQSPYHSEYSNSPQFSPAFSEPPSPWVNINEGVEMDAVTVGVPSTCNQRSSEKMKADEGLGNGATISAVLYANMNHPEWKTEYPVWSERYKQIIKKWRTLSSDQKNPYLQKARDNRSQLRMKKQQQSQIVKEPSTPSPVAVAKPPPNVPSLTSNLPSPGAPLVTQTQPSPTTVTTEEQEKVAQQQKTAREAEQERQWKQLQALRQQQAQQQQHVIHEQRVQAIARVQRTISDPSPQFLPSNQPSPLQVSTAQQEGSPVASPSPRQFIGIKSPPFAHPSPPSANIRTPSQSPVHDFQQQQNQPPPNPDADSFVEASNNSNANSFSKANLSPGNDSFGQPHPPRTPFAAPRPTLQRNPDQPEITRQLRDLLQRQQQQQQQQEQAKNFDLVQQKQPARIWNPNDSPRETVASSGPSSGEDMTFRQPLPPTLARPRMPLPLGVRPNASIRMQTLDGRLQGLDPRLRLILQHQTRMALPGQHLASSTVRYATAPGASRPATIEQYEQLLQRQAQIQARNSAVDQASNTTVRMPVVQSGNSVIQKPNSSVNQSIPVIQSEAANDQEIPDNVTAELEKLEQETGTMAELQGVSEILGGLGEDDDELLAEMGADFNILEYADPELETLAGEKTNILDLELEDENLKQERRKEAMLQKQNASNRAASASKLSAATTQEEKKEAFVPAPTAEESPKPQTPVISQPSVNPLPPHQHKNNPDNMAGEPVARSSATVPDAAIPSPLSNSQLSETLSQQPQPPQLSAVVQQQPQPSLPQQPNLTLTAQQIHQQMLHQVGCKMSKYVQQAADMGKPMPPGSKLQTSDGIIGIVLANNNVQLQIPPHYQQRLLLQLQNQKLSMRVGRPVPRPALPDASPPGQAVPGQAGRVRMPLPAAPPPPPYPGPPPPYPGNLISQQQMGLRMGPGFHPHMGLVHPLALPGFPMHPHFERRPLLLEEQPLLLEDLLEQEKRELKKQVQSHPPGTDIRSNESEPSALMSDQDFERLKADVFSSNDTGPTSGNVGMVQQHWQPNRMAPVNAPPAQATTEITTRVQMFNAKLLPAPPLPPETIATEQDKQTQLIYEQWLNHQNTVLTQQLKYYETEVNKLRKSRKSLNSKQRQLRKSGNQLSEIDSNELQRISAEQAILQKHLESSRKQSRQHGMLIQEYRNKQQSQKPLMGGPAQLPSPLGPPGSSPIHHPATSHSPMLSPQQSPMTQHNSPMNSPSPIIAHSPSPASVAALLQSPSGSVSPIQPSSRIGTPLPQEGSPGPAQSPSQICLPPPAPRMTSPQHRRVVTSPVGYSGDIRNSVNQMRFVRPSADHNPLQRIRNHAPNSLQNFPPKTGTASPLNSPPLNQMTLTQQQLLQKQFHQQALLHQQQQQQQQQQQTQQNPDGSQADANILHSSRMAQLIQQQRNLNRSANQQSVIQTQNLTPQQQHQLLAKQQQQQQIALQLQARLSQQQQQSSAPHSPMTPKSPLHTQQTMSPHSMPTSPMPPKSPMISFNQQNTPSSPAARSYQQSNVNQQPPSSPLMHQYQPPSSPMMIQSPHAMRRPPSASSSPAMPERPTSVENPGTPRTPYSMDGHFQENLHTGGGNPNNPTNPVPLPPPDFCYSKLGLRGGTPMWSGFGRGEKRVPTPPTGSGSGNDVDKQPGSDLQNKPKKEPHLSKVSILKKKSSLLRSSPKPNQINSDFNDYDEMSSNSPVTPPSVLVNKTIGPRMLSKPESTAEKQLLSDMVDYEDDNSTILSSEISLSSAAQQNDDEMDMTETLSQNDIGEVLSSPMEADQISDEFLLFPGNMVVDLAGNVQYSDKEEAEDEYTNFVIRSPTTSDDEFIMQDRTKKYNIINIAEVSASPEQDAATEPSTEPEDEEVTQPFEESEVLIIDQPAKSPEEQISTKEDFEELIDEGSRKEQLKQDTKTATDFQKFATTSVYSFPPKNPVTVSRPQTVAIGSKASPKISLIAAAPIIQNFSTRTDPTKLNSEPQQLILTPTTKINTTNAGSKLTSIILTRNPVRSNILSVGPKLVTQAPGITFVSASTSQIASILPSKFTVPVISASAVRQLPNVKVIDKPSSSLSLTTHDNNLPKKIFDDDSVSTDEEKSHSFDEKVKSETSIAGGRLSMFGKNTTKSEHNVERKVDKHKSEMESMQHHIVTKEKVQMLASPIITKSVSPVIIHHSQPELKMTAQVIQESSTRMQITATETVSTFDGSSEDKSVVISIPSPTPSQEQMLDNIALQALEENRRREFDSFDDVLDMIENMQHTDTSEQSEVTERKQTKITGNIEIKGNSTLGAKEGSHVDIEVNANKQTMPQLSPLSQPSDLTTNMANASKQLRSLLSNLQTTTTSHTSNVDTAMVKAASQKILNVSSSAVTAPVVASKVIQQISTQSQGLTSVNTVIVPNIKQKLTTNPNPSIRTVSTPASTTSGQHLLTNKPDSTTQSKPISSGSIHPQISTSVAQISNKSNVTTDVNKKASLTLTAMLQNQPAATPTTKPSADTITAASLLATPVSLSRSNFSPTLAQAQPNAAIATTNTSSNTSTSGSSVISSSFRTITSTNLLHTHLTKSRTKSLDDIKDLKTEDVKPEQAQYDSDILSSIKQELAGCKYSSLSQSSQNYKGEDSQNVLLKKLLQNTACASTQSPPPNATSTVTVTAPSTESQKVMPPTLSSLLPPVVKSEPQIVTTASQTRSPIQRVPIRETSFVSSPVIQHAPVSSNTTQQLHIDVKKCAPPSRSSSKDDLLSPPTPRSSCSQDSSLQTPPLIIKKETFAGNNLEIKKELLDETSQHSEVSDQGKMDVQIKEEPECGDMNIDRTILDKEELKKRKRRMYNQKRRQNQLLNKEANKPNKRPRKNSKLDEDYDAYIDSVLSQIRNLPPMVVSEPVLVRNYGVLPVFGSGDLSKIGTKSFDSRVGELTGTYGNASIPGYADFYSTKPYGDEEPIPEKPPSSTQRGFYDQEFPLIRFDTEDDKKFDLFSRDDTPDTVISCSSPECDILHANDRYLGLKLISDDDEEDTCTGRTSPKIPIVKPIAIRLQQAGLIVKDSLDISDNKENILKEVEQEKLKPEHTPPEPLKDNDNIKVTLTLTSSAAEDIVGVLRDLANILQIAPPTTYQIVDRTSPTAQKLGMYRTKGKDGKEGAPIDIQSILNGAAKFCKHCDVVILNNSIKKKLSDLPFLAKDFESLGDGEELYFCSSTCYMQFALMHRSPSISEDKAAAIIDHLSQKDRHVAHFKHITVNTYNQKSNPNRIPSDFKLEDSRNTNFSSYLKQVKMGLTKPLEQNRAHKNTVYKLWSPGCLQPNQKHKKPTDKEMMEMLYQMGITVVPPKMPEDVRKCMFCQVTGDGVADGPARLLNVDVDKWVHLNCALWSDGVYETVNGALMNLENAMQQSLTTSCAHCGNLGATIRCFKTRCTGVYHLSCAVRDSCVFFKNKTVFCTTHVPKNEKDSELTTLSVSRRVYVNRDENRQVAAVMHHSDTNNLLRVGSLIFLNVGQLLPHQLQTFHTANYIYPIGYKIIRFYWSMRHLNKRCRYVCSIHDAFGRPEFRIVVQEYAEKDVEFKGQSPKGVWNQILENIASIRRGNKCLQMFPKYISGEDLFGLTEPAIVRVLESLPGIETLPDYKFKYGRNPLLELPLAINPSGAARSEPRLRHQTHWKRPHTQRTTGSTSRPLFGPPSAGSSTPTSFGETVCPYSKQFVHSKSSQYKKMKMEWRNNVFLARSKIQGLGLYAARDLEKHTMVIEYIGEVIRTELSECREKQYEAKNRGIYMFRLDDDRVVDATLSGGLARYINHSCNPNCVAETVEIDRDLKIIIFAKRRIQRGEELAYDYKFDIEDDQNKISCMCGAPNCRKWMN